MDYDASNMTHDPSLFTPQRFPRHPTTETAPEDLEDWIYNMNSSTSPDKSPYRNLSSGSPTTLAGSPKKSSKADAIFRQQLEQTDNNTPKVRYSVFRKRSIAAIQGNRSEVQSNYGAYSLYSHLTIPMESSTTGVRDLLARNVGNTRRCCCQLTEESSDDYPLPPDSEDWLEYAWGFGAPTDPETLPETEQERQPTFGTPQPPFPSMTPMRVSLKTASSQRHYPTISTEIQEEIIATMEQEAGRRKAQHPRRASTEKQETTYCDIRNVRRGGFWHELPLSGHKTKIMFDAGTKKTPSETLPESQDKKLTAAVNETADETTNSPGPVSKDAERHKAISEQEARLEVSTLMKAYEARSAQEPLSSSTSPGPEVARLPALESKRGTVTVDYFPSHDGNENSLEATNGALGQEDKSSSISPDRPGGNTFKDFALGEETGKTGKTKNVGKRKRNHQGDYLTAEANFSPRKRGKTAEPAGKCQSRGKTLVDAGENELLKCRERSGIHCNCVEELKHVKDTSKDQGARNTSLAEREKQLNEREAQLRDQEIQLVGRRKEFELWVDYYKGKRQAEKSSHREREAYLQQREREEQLESLERGIFVEEIIGCEEVLRKRKRPVEGTDGAPGTSAGGSMVPSSDFILQKTMIPFTRLLGGITDRLDHIKVRD